MQKMRSEGKEGGKGMQTCEAEVADIRYRPAYLLSSLFS
jgi:hypothetical protein